MIRFLRSINLEQISFWIGFLAATIFWWLAVRLRPYFRRFFAWLRTQMQSARAGLTASAEQRIRANTLKYAQGLHLAAPLFALDEILIPPRLLAPPPVIAPGSEPPTEDIVSMAAPYAPDWPELAGVFEAHSFTLIEALQGGAHLMLIGRPGSGKTVALAHLASQLARRDPALGDFQNHLPVFLHATELSLPAENPENPLGVIENAIAARSSLMAQSRLPELLASLFESGQIFLLIDGLDEMPLPQMEEVAALLRVLLEQFPSIRLICTAAVMQLGSLPTLGVIPVPMAAWSLREQALFIQQWSRLWAQFVVLPEAQQARQIDPLLLNGWLFGENATLTPLEITLKIWSAYAGDVRGPGAIDALEAYLRRMSVNIPKARQALEHLASQAVTTLRASFTPAEAQAWISGVEPLPLPDDFAALDEAGDQKQGAQKESIPRILPELLRSGLLVQRAKEQVGFAHPVLLGYLAGSALAAGEQIRLILSQPEWPLKTLSLEFAAHWRDLGPIAQELATQADDPLQQGLLTAGRWLRLIPTEASWRKPVLQQLSNTLQNELLPMALRIRVLAALLASRDPGVVLLFRHLLKSHQDSTRQLAALGCGFSRDAQAVGDLVRLLDDMPAVSRAACLALATISTKPALEALAEALLQGNEELRRSAAEAFANHPEEGYPALRDGVTVDDLLVRRSVIYGLRRVREPWARQILESMQIEEGQWVVRNAAAQVVEELNQLDPCIPQKLPPLEDVPWLIAFAGERGMGISPGDPAKEMLKLALKEGSVEQCIAALDQFRLRGITDVFPSLYHFLYGEEPELKDIAYNTLWHLTATGSPVPPPKQFGLGY